MSFVAQQQTVPGVQTRMNPVPDCGEKSYRGSGKLTGKRAIITGGGSGFGRAVAIAHAPEGADVLISYLNEHDDARDVAHFVRPRQQRNSRQQRGAGPDMDPLIPSTIPGKACNPSERTRPWAVPASRSSSRRSMCCWPPTRRATPPERGLPSPEAGRPFNRNTVAFPGSRRGPGSLLRVRFGYRK
jgi:hypothetical protein